MAFITVWSLSTKPTYKVSVLGPKGNQQCSNCVYFEQDRVRKKWDASKRIARCNYGRGNNGNT